MSALDAVEREHADAAQEEHAGLAGNRGRDLVGQVESIELDGFDAREGDQLVEQTPPGRKGSIKMTWKRGN